MCSSARASTVSLASLVLNGAGLREAFSAVDHAAHDGPEKQSVGKNKVDNEVSAEPELAPEPALVLFGQALRHN